MRTPIFAVATLLSAAIAAPAAAQRAHIGGHVGYQFDQDWTVLGGQMTLPLNYNLELYPSVDVYLVDVGSLTGFNGDLKYRFMPGARLQLYGGGGINVLRSNGASDTGWDLFAGLESRRAAVHPYVEGRWLFHTGSTFQVNAGLNFTLF
jgi:hypothetical protein